MDKRNLLTINILSLPFFNLCNIIEMALNVVQLFPDELPQP